MPHAVVPHATMAYSRNHLDEAGSPSIVPRRSIIDRIKDRVKEKACRVRAWLKWYKHGDKDVAFDMVTPARST